MLQLKKTIDLAALGKIIQTCSMKINLYDLTHRIKGLAEYNSKALSCWCLIEVHSFADLNH